MGKATARRARSDPYPRLISRSDRSTPIGPNHTVPSGTVPFLRGYQAINCLATFTRSLRDKRPVIPSGQARHYPNGHNLVSSLPTAKPYPSSQQQNHHNAPNGQKGVGNRKTNKKA